MKIGEGLIVFVTGGASGLGEAAVLQLHNLGATIAIADFNVEAMQALSARLQVRILCIVCDVTNEKDVKHAIDKTVMKFGTIHVALTSAGTNALTPTLTVRGSLDVKMFDRLMNVNFYGGLYVAKYASIVMSKNQKINEKGEKGLILFVSSLSGEMATRGQFAYAASKGAINGMLMPMARDLGRYGIRVAAVQPGMFDTPMSKGFANKEIYVKKAIPLNRIGTPDEFAHMV